jgi:EpsD family peptidyl-prolyl cis-trans isomerase
MLAGCNAKEDSGKASSSQVAVKVNKEEISVHQINGLLSRRNDIPPDQIDRARSAAAERLIDQELLLQQAKLKKLDRNPNVMQMIEFSRRDILARAYGEEIMGGAVQPTDAQIADFYDKNPEMFSKRRIYNLQEINMQVSADRLDEVRAQVQAAGNPQQIVNWLNEQKIQFAVNVSIKPAEQIPPEVLKRIGGLNAGQAIFIGTTTGAVLVFIGGVRDEPIDRTAGKPIIQNILLNQARAESIRAEIKRLRDAASIEYVGEFKPPAEAEPPAPAAKAPTEQSESSSEGDSSVQSMIEKGGIKLK